MPNPTASYLACLTAGVLLLLASYPLHAVTPYWLGLSITVATFVLPNVVQVVAWRIKPAPPPRDD